MIVMLNIKSSASFEVWRKVILHTFIDSSENIFSIHCPCHLLTPASESYQRSQMYFLIAPFIRRTKCKTSRAMFLLLCFSFLQYIIFQRVICLAYHPLFSLRSCRQKTDDKSQAWEQTECITQGPITPQLLLHKIVLADR